MEKWTLARRGVRLEVLFHVVVVRLPAGRSRGGGRDGRMRLQLTIFKDKIKNCSNIHLGKQLGKRPWPGTVGNRLGQREGVTPWGAHSGTEGS